MKHISLEAVEDFLACRLSREESRAFVRHLLRCPACPALTSKDLCRIHLPREGVSSAAGPRAGRLFFCVPARNGEGRRGSES